MNDRWREWLSGSGFEFNGVDWSKLLADRGATKLYLEVRDGIWKLHERHHSGLFDTIVLPKQPSNLAEAAGILACMTP